jgi:hypothetical protein
MSKLMVNRNLRTGGSGVGTLQEEMDAIHLANCWYWRQGQRQTMAAKASYHRRVDRLEEIRCELCQRRPAYPGIA